MRRALAWLLEWWDIHHGYTFLDSGSWAHDLHARLRKLDWWNRP